MSLQTTVSILSGAIVIVTGLVTGVAWMSGYLDRELGGRIQAAVDKKFPGHPISVTDLEGAVVAFDLSNGCPDGWDPFEDAHGLFVVGAGESAHLKFRQLGGTEEFMLVHDEIPAHQHPIVATNADGTNINLLGWGMRMEIGDGIKASPDRRRIPVRGVPPKQDGTGRPRAGMLFAGPGDHQVKPHENMPPYIALHYCRKQSS